MSELVDWCVEVNNGQESYLVHTFSGSETNLSLNYP